jgi:hypothetical protein
VKTSRIFGYVAVAFAYAYGCGSSPAPSISPSTTSDGGAAESGDDGDDTETDARGLTVTDARAQDERERDVASDGPAVDGTPYVAPSTNSDQSCCVNGAYYVCPTAAALAQCASACTHVPSYDTTCVAFDAGSSGSSAPAPAPLPTRTNACGGYFMGIPCMAGGQCYGSDEHCNGGSCYPNDVGNPCTYPNDCGSANHCTGGCCQSPAKGSPCTAPWDCKSMTCTNNVCQ